MNRDELRLWLGKKVGFRDLPEPIWRKIEREYEDYFDSVLADDDVGLTQRQDLLQTARDYLDFYNEMRALDGVTAAPPQPRPGPVGWVSGAVHVEPDPLEIERAFALSTALATRASLQESVRSIRAELLHNELVTPLDFEQFCFSPVCRFAAASDLAHWKTALAKHRVETWEYRRIGMSTDSRTFQGSQDDYLLYSTGWYGPGNDDDLVVRNDAIVKLRIPHVELAVSRSVDSPVHHVELALGQADKPPYPGFLRWIIVWHGSILYQLHGVAKHLSNQFPWTEGQALRFLVTGEIPKINFISASCEIPGSAAKGHAYELVNLRVAPWLSTETVATLYRQFQLGYFGKRFRRLEARAVTLVRFIESQKLDAVTNGTGEPTWSMLRREWNQKWPKWKYQDDNIIKDYRRALSTVLFPSWLALGVTDAEGYPPPGIVIEVAPHEMWMVPDAWHAQPESD